MKQKQKQKDTQATAAAGKKLPAWAVGILVLAAVAGAGFWLSRSKPAPTTNDTSAAQTNLSAPAATSGAAPTNSDFVKLMGRWQRPDGGYFLIITSVDAGGKMEATYLNPNPIHVARAEASREGTTNKVFVELQDVNYPGSTYKLAYDPASDQLYGVYFQAALNQQFDVVFARK
jgi:hypothetical protein